VTVPRTDIDGFRRKRREIHASLAEQLRDISSDPVQLAEEAVGKRGLDFLRGWLGPEIPPPPPIVWLLGMEWVEIDEGRAVLAMEPAYWMYSPLGLVHGGIAATLLDTVLACAVHTTLDAGVGYTTSDLHVRFLRTMSESTGRVVATGEVAHAGRRHATAEGRLHAEETGKLIATATAGCTILGPEPG
jgi:uncharacterized protein (TIGR00369 family)